MLTVWTGPDRAALTQLVLNEISKSASAGVSGQVLIVPEQFSHEAERRLCQTGGDTISRYAEVLSLSRLSDRLAAHYGGAARAYLDKGGRLLSMASAAEQVSSKIKLYASVLRKPEFLTDMVRMIGEFRSYCLEPSTLLDMSRIMDGVFAQKLEELGLLYEAYLAVCAQGKADPADKLVSLREALADCDWADGRTFYFDGFSDFTGAELAVIEVLLCQSAQTYITLSTGPTGGAMEQLAVDTIGDLRRVAQNKDIPFRVITRGGYVPRDSRVQSLLRWMFSAEPVPSEKSEAIRLGVFDSVEEECRGAVLQVLEYLKQGSRCRDISVACTDLDLYKAPLQAAFATVGLPVYYAGEIDVMAHPVVKAVWDCLLAASGHLDYEDGAMYLKSGLAPLERDCCDRLDNYAYLWNLHGTQWENPWVQHPRGFGEPWTDEDSVLLERLNVDKKIALAPLLHLRRELHAAQNTGHMVLALHQFMEDVNLRQQLEEKANTYEKNGNGQKAQALLQIYEILIQSLEQLWLTLGQTDRQPEDFAKLYASLLSQYAVGTIPASVDQVHVSDLPDMRHRQTKHLIVLGAADGSFPAYKTSEGLLTEDERMRLQSEGVSIAPGRARQMEQEIGRIYSALSAACESLSMSYAGDQPAWLFRRAASQFPDSLRTEHRSIFLELADFAAWRLRNGYEDSVTVDGLVELEQALRRKRGYSFAPLARKTVMSLYGEPIALSPSKIDQYAACRFAFFMNYGMKAKPRKQAKLDQPAFGTFVHAVLEHTVLRVKDLGGFRELDETRLLEIAAEEIEAYTQTHFPKQAEREAYLYQRSLKEIREIVLDLWEEMRNSQFQPEFCELKFGANGLLPMIEIEGKTARSRITGTVDRVDLYEDHTGTYVRIVDYKTGSKSFDYTDILNGAGLQMLIYLFALQEFAEPYLHTPHLEPAGVLYLPAKKEYPLTEPLPDDASVEKKHREKRKRKGLIRSDETLLAAMEADPMDPQYMPYTVKKAGPSGDLADCGQMKLLEKHVLRTVGDMTDRIASGQVVPDPMVRGPYSPCRYCDYQTVCHKDLGMQMPRNLAETSAKEFWEKLAREEMDHG